MRTLGLLEKLYSKVVQVHLSLPVLDDIIQRAVAVFL